jgi:hypothetical protein
MEEDAREVKIINTGSEKKRHPAGFYSRVPFLFK